MRVQRNMAGCSLGAAYIRLVLAALFAGVSVGMVLERQPAVGPLQLVLAGVGAHAEDFVVGWGATHPCTFSWAGPPQKRINIRKILSLNEVINQPYQKVTIELKKNYNLKEISELLSINGETEVNLVIKDKDKEACYSLQNNRKFDLKHLKALKEMEYVEKITV